MVDPVSLIQKRGKKQGNSSRAANFLTYFLFPLLYAFFFTHRNINTNTTTLTSILLECESNLAQNRFMRNDSERRKGAEVGSRGGGEEIQSERGDRGKRGRDTREGEKKLSHCVFTVLHPERKHHDSK